MALFNGRTPSDPRFDYEALRDQMVKDFAHRILNDGLGRGRLAELASAKYGFNVSTKQARRVVGRVKREAEIAEEVPVPEALDLEVDLEAGRAKAIFEEVPGPDELLAALGINEDEWRVEKCVIKPYQGQQKNKRRVGTSDEGEPIYEDFAVVKQMYSAEVRLAPKEVYEREDFVESLLDQIANRAPIYTANIVQPDSGNMSRLLIPDAHLGKPGFQSDWGIDTARERILSVVSEFVSLSKTQSVDRIRIPLGHDLLHIDRENISRSGTLHTTSSGTPVERTHPWRELFFAGCDLANQIVRICLEVAPVDIHIIPGNHSGHSEIAIGRVMISEFSNSDDVNVTFAGDFDHFSTWGVNAFMDSHGDCGSFSDLPLYFAVQAQEIWAYALWREVNVGHKHISKNRPVGYSTNEKGNVLCKISPSLSPQDAWHSKYQFHGSPGAECHIYNESRPGPFASYQRHF